MSTAEIPRSFLPENCPLLGCSEQLHVVWALDRPIYSDDDTIDWQDPPNTVQFEVVCEAGHRVDSTQGDNDYVRRWNLPKFRASGSGELPEEHVDEH